MIAISGNAVLSRSKQIINMELPDLAIGDISPSLIWLFCEIFDLFRHKKVESNRYLNKFKGTKRDIWDLLLDWSMLEQDHDV